MSFRIRGVDVEAPEVMRRRLPSVRAFDRDDMMIAADVTEGTELRALVERLLAVPAVACLHVHYARFGCRAGRVDRA